MTAHGGVAGTRDAARVTHTSSTEAERTGDHRAAVVTASTAWSVVAISALVTLGWALDVAVLTSAVPGLQGMVASTALALPLAATALLLLRHAPQGRARLRTVAVCASVVLGLGLLGLSEYIGSGTPRVFLPVDDTPGWLVRPSPHTAIALTLVGATLLAMCWHPRQASRLENALLTADVIVVLAAVTGYTYGLDYLLGTTDVTGMAVTTVAALILLVIGMVWLSMGRGLDELVAADRPSGVLLRRGLPMVLAGPLAIGFLRLQAQRQGLVSTESGVFAATMATMALLAWLTWVGMRELDRVEARRADAEQRLLAGERDTAREALRVSEGRFRRIFEDAPSGIALASLDGKITQVNPAFCAITGHTPDEAVGRSLAEFTDVSGGSNPALITRLISDQADRLRIEKRYWRADGSMVDVSTTTGIVRELDGHPISFVTHVQDISGRKRLEERLQYLADHDHLTGMFNRRRFEEELNREIARANRTGVSISLLILDLDHFKEVNDHHGHQAGDDLLSRVGEVIRLRLRASDVCARLGGDEFAALLPDTSPEQAMLAAQSLCAAVRETNQVALPGGPNRVTATVGVAWFDPSGDVVPEQLLRLADMALYEGKERGRDQAHLYRAPEHERQPPQSRPRRADPISRALAQDRLTLHAQPIVSLDGDTHPWHELLVRMRDENGRTVPAGEFVPAAERLDQIPELDGWVVRTAIGLLAVLQPRQPNVRLSVNISAHSLNDDFAQLVATELNCHSVDPRGLCVEIAQAATLTDSTSAADVTDRLRALGCQIALEGFGAGADSLHNLERFHSDYVKLERDFAHHLQDPESNERLIRSLVDIAHGLHARTVAALVEDQGTLELARRCGVDYAQGFYLGRPCPSSDLDLAAIATTGN